MYRVINMGIGMTAVCSSEEMGKSTTALPQAKVIGEIAKAKEEKRINSAITIQTAIIKYVLVILLFLNISYLKYILLYYTTSCYFTFCLL